MLMGKNRGLFLNMELPTLSIMWVRAAGIYLLPMAKLWGGGRGVCFFCHTPCCIHTYMFVACCLLVFFFIFYLYLGRACACVCFCFCGVPKTHIYQYNICTVGGGV